MRSDLLGRGEDTQLGHRRAYPDSGSCLEANCVDVRNAKRLSWHETNTCVLRLSFRCSAPNLTSNLGSDGDRLIEANSRRSEQRAGAILGGYRARPIPEWLCRMQSKNPAEWIVLREIEIESDAKGKGRNK